MVSRGALIKELQRVDQFAQFLFVELFCANPYHEYFKNFTEVELASMRLERMRRMTPEVVEEPAGSVTKNHGCFSILSRIAKRIFQKETEQTCPQSNLPPA
jgi:hypothetical protein